MEESEDESGEFFPVPESVEYLSLYLILHPLPCFLSSFSGPLDSEQFSDTTKFWKLWEKFWLDREPEIIVRVFSTEIFAEYFRRLPFLESERFLVFAYLRWNRSSNVDAGTSDIEL